MKAARTPFVIVLLIASQIIASRTQAQLADDSSATANSEGFFSFNSRLSMGLGFLRSDNFEAIPGLAYEGGVSLRYTYDRIAFDLGILGSSRTVHMAEDGIRSLNLSYSVISPSIIMTKGIMTSSVGLGIGIPVSASYHGAHGKQEIPLGSLDPLYELRGQLMFSLGDWMPFNLFVAGTVPLNNGGTIDLGDRQFFGRSGTLQFGITNK